MVWRNFTMCGTEIMGVSAKWSTGNRVFPAKEVVGLSTRMPPMSFFFSTKKGCYSRTNIRRNLGRSSESCMVLDSVQAGRCKENTDAWDDQKVNSAPPQKKNDFFFALLSQHNDERKPYHSVLRCTRGCVLFPVFWYYKKLTTILMMLITHMFYLKQTKGF